MKIHHIRNATMIIETNNHVILVDPMLGPKGSMAPFSFIRHKARKNPIVSMPVNSTELLTKVTHCLITHLHMDHLDKAGEQFLIENNIPVIGSVKDEKELLKKGLNVVDVIEYWKQKEFLDGTIEGIPSRHGYGYVAKPMGNVMGFYIKLKNEPSVYLSSDTIYTDDVNKVLMEYKPDISVVASGSAQLDLFKPLLMTIDEILKFTKNAPGQVIANHLEAVNHCPTTRTQLREIYAQEGLTNKTFVPEDGEVMVF
ncbi:MAG: MBL fold metallo-hydrolase [Winogradskyella sp.]|uniref:MBL fold metallo-hydrolase n=1 Tax=Winogradskyella sp. TaxID=1883156 RepID=UPI0025DB7115|nr:MBL fold metallo-hydrolase [Winogradskyella sp.]NRB59065.1 MBL fold metallo-hydrolase [Winogradskyella sp.]